MLSCARRTKKATTCVLLSLALFLWFFTCAQQLKEYFIQAMESDHYVNIAGLSRGRTNFSHVSWLSRPPRIEYIDILSLRRGLEKDATNFMKHPDSVSKLYNFEVTQRRRNAVLEHNCRHRQRLSRSALHQSVHHILVVDSLKLAFCQVRKASSIAWRRALDEISKNRGAGSVRSLGTYTDANRERILKDYVKVVFVREPLERLVSAWNNKFAKGRFYEISHGPMIVSKYRKSHATPFQISARNIEMKRKRTNLNHKSSSSQDLKHERLNITFEEFARYILDPEVSVTTGADMHWQDVDTRCAPCDVMYDFIGHFETITVDAQKILKVINVEVPPVFLEEHRSKTLSILQREFKKLPEAMIEKLGVKYETDYRLFGYSLQNVIEMKHEEFDT